MKINTIKLNKDKNGKVLSFPDLARRFFFL